MDDIGAGPGRNQRHHHPLLPPKWAMDGKVTQRKNLSHRLFFFFLHLKERSKIVHIVREKLSVESSIISFGVCGRGPLSIRLYQTMPKTFIDLPVD